MGKTHLRKRDCSGEETTHRHLSGGPYSRPWAFLLLLASLALSMLACQALTRLSSAPLPIVSGESGSLLFQDDFSDPTSGWDRVRDQDGITDYEGRAYRIQLEKPNWYFWSTPGLRFGDVRVEVDATKSGGPDINEFGLICRSQNLENFYFFTITSDGYFAVSKFQAGDETLIGMDQMQPSPVIRRGEATNHLRVDCIGSYLGFYVNDQLLVEVADQDFTSGDVGLIAGTFEEPGVDIRFDNFSVVVP